jgi:poly-gamma-glutamate synthesis protein (capsule biosynthesis protein)
MKKYFLPSGEATIKNVLAMNSYDDILTIGLAGDVMIGRGVDPMITQYGYAYPWGTVLPILRQTDINIINLETALTHSNHKVQKVFNFKATPDKVQTLVEAHITLANLANNHILDYSEEGLAETIYALSAAGIQHVGAGMDDYEAARPEIISKKDVRLGLLGFTDNEPSWKAGEEKCGTCYINVSKTKDREVALTAIRQLKEITDCVTVSIHWGYNMVEKPSSAFIGFAHQMIDAGADIIHGHSAHIFQAIEVYQQKLILYDTGDFVDDYIVDEDLRNDRSFLFLTRVDKNEIIELKLVPVAISACQVNLAEEDDYKWSIRRMQQLSARFGTEINNYGEVQVV